MTDKIKKEKIINTLSYEEYLKKYFPSTSHDNSPKIDSAEEYGVWIAEYALSKINNTLKQITCK